MKPVEIRGVLMYAILRTVLSGLFLWSAFPGAGKAQTSPASIPPIELPDGFTLTYKVIVKDVRTEDQRNAAIKGIRASYEDSVQRGETTREMVDKLVKPLEEATSHPQPPVEMVVTLTAQAGKLLYQRVEASRASPSVVIYDGMRTIAYDGNMGDLTPGLATYEMTPCILPATGIPGLHLLKSAIATETLPNALRRSTGDVSWPESTNSLLRYCPGNVQAALLSDGSAKILQAETIFHDQITTRWIFSDHRRFLGQWIAGRMRRIQADRFGKPFKETSYVLQNASSTPVDANLFDYRHWFKTGDKIFVPDGGDKIEVSYDAAKGSLDDQIERQQFLIEAHKNLIAHGAVAGHANSGLFVLGALVCATTAFWFRRRVGRG